MNETNPNLRWEVLPFVGVTNGVQSLVFGMFSNEVNRILGEAQVFKKSSECERATHEFAQFGLHLYYDANERLECIEIVGGFAAYFQHVLLSNAPIESVLGELSSLGLSYRYDDGYFLENLGVVLYAPNDSVEAVTVYRRGYFDY